jgi:hypothetical protein
VSDGLKRANAAVQLDHLHFVILVSQHRRILHGESPAMQGQLKANNTLNAAKWHYN